jgi:hypothetical protein
VDVGVFRDPFEFGDTADVFRVRADNVYCLLLN